MERTDFLHGFGSFSSSVSFSGDGRWASRFSGRVDGVGVEGVARIGLPAGARVPVPVPFFGPTPGLQGHGRESDLDDQ